MDDCGQKEHHKSIKMGASSNADTTKIASLQERKKHIQEKLDKHHKELRKLCIDEAELTGQLPIEYPFEQGEVAPTFRRRIGTSYQLNKNLLNNLNNEEEITVLEMEMHMQTTMAQAALGLAESTSNKGAKKAHQHDYETHMSKYKALENKMHDMKISTSQMLNLQKHKKKPRPEKELGDSVSMNLNLSSDRSDPFAKPFRHSLRSLQYQSTQAQAQTLSVQAKPRPASQRFVYLVPDGIEQAQQQVQQAQHQSMRDLTHGNVNYPAVKLEPTFYKLSLDGYKQYEDKQESLDVAVNEGHFRSYPAQGISRTLPHASRRSPGYAQAYTHHQHTHTMRATHNHSPGTSTSTSSMKYYPIGQVQHPQQAQHTQVHASRQYYDARVPPNPLQLQPHQQYENVMTSSSVTSGAGSGLGGYWKQSENGEFWCNNSNSSESMKDKRFGSLDRRKNKRLQKKSALVADAKSATMLPAVPSYEEATRTLPSKSQAIAARRHENRQLVRTQSLGSVGNMLDVNCPSDDSSCGSENINSELLRKNKQKEWYETSLDGPPCPLALTPTPSLPPMRARTHSHSHSIAPSIAPEDKYLDYATSPAAPSPAPAPAHAHPHPHSHHYQQTQHSQHAHHTQHSPQLPAGRVHSPQLQMQMLSHGHHSPQLPAPPPPPSMHSPASTASTSTAPKEIPAESNPSPRGQHENREIFNNNMPKNCTVVQQAQWKPYHEETKPFEMADFYKYSTKYKKKPEEAPMLASPAPSTGSREHRQSVGSTGSGFRNLPSNRTSDVNVNMVGNTSNANSSFESNPLSPHVADNFSAEMNAWYQKHEHQSDNNNATLV